MQGELEVLGLTQLRVGGCLVSPRGRQALTVLAVLALDGPKSRLELADLLWDMPSAGALHNLRMALGHLRGALGAQAGVILQDRDQLSVAPGALWVDALQLHSPDHDLLLAAWRGPLLPLRRTYGPEGWLEWVQRTEARLLGGHCAALLERANAAPPRLAARLARRALDLRPLDDAAARQLSEALLRGGQRSDAALLRRSFAARFAAEFGQLPELGWPVPEAWTAEAS